MNVEKQEHRIDRRVSQVLSALCVGAAVLFTASNAMAQSTAATASTSTEATRPALTTVRGDTGLWYVPTAEVLPSKKWSFSLSRLETNEGQGFTNISSFPVSFGVGVGGHAEIFGSWNALTRIDRDTQPLFFANSATAGIGGGLSVDYPLDRAPFVSKRGDLRLGAKINLMSQADTRPMSVAIRAIVKLPTGDKTSGTTSGKVDFSGDLVVSRDTAKSVEISAYAGYLVRGTPAGYTLTNGVRWGVGAGFPSRSRFRVTTELYGEMYSSHTISAPAGLIGTDGSAVPVSSTITNPIILNLGLTFQAKNGFFIGGGANYNLSMGKRSDVSSAFTSESLEAADYQLRIGFHPGVRRHVKAVPPPPPAPAPAPIAAEPPPPPVHTLTVKAACSLCSVQVGQTDTVTATAQDSIGCALVYQWSAPTGTFASATRPSTGWTAPGQDGSVPIMVTATCPSDNKTASDSVNIQVIKPAVKVYEFEDVYFDFDRYTLRPDALRVLDDAVSAMQADRTLTLTIEGHTCDIGTPEYNLALGERRAKAVSDYFTSRGIDAGRLKSVSYGEESPKYDNSREETRRLNRRAALVVTLRSN